MFNIAPKRPNWDLKREMEKKLAKLERRTQEAIHTLIRQFYRLVFNTLHRLTEDSFQGNGLRPRKATRMIW